MKSKLKLKQEMVEMDSNYFIMSLPGSTEEEFLLTISYTPVSKNNMTGMMIARCDGDHYGELKLYRMPKGKTVYGPAQVEAQIDQDPNISKEFSLWSQRGSTYLRGNMFVIPVEDSLMYVEPIYLQADQRAVRDAAPGDVLLNLRGVRLVHRVTR